MAESKIPAVIDETPPILFQYRCKICQLAKSHPQIFKDLHQQVLEIGSSQTRSMNYINSRIEAEKLPIMKLNNQNMTAHFSNHITLPERVSVEITKQHPYTPPELKEVDPDMGYFIENMVRRKVGTEVTDYLNLDQLRSQISEKLELLDTIVGQEPGKVDMPAMQLYAKLVTEIRNCIVDLNKIRQGKQLINSLIKSLIESYTFEVARQLTRDYDQIQVDLIAAGLDSSKAMNFSQGLKLHAAQIMAQTARSSIEDILKMYKI